VVPTVIAGETATSLVGEFTATVVAGRLTEGLVAVPPDSSTKATVVAPLTKPVPETVTDVPPLVGPVAGLRPVTAGTTGDQPQLSTDILVPQYT
jgi:hypothetical protein